jgi:hypothetical protein
MTALSCSETIQAVITDGVRCATLAQYYAEDAAYPPNQLRIEVMKRGELVLLVKGTTGERTY